MPDFKAKVHQIRFRLGLRPRPRWGSLQHSPTPPSCTYGALLLREGGKGLEGSGVAGPLAAQRGGQICRPFVLGFFGIPVYSDHAIAAYFAYFAKMRISHIFPHIMAFFKISNIYLCI